jgi:hypothetical protein
MEEEFDRFCLRSLARENEDVFGALRQREEVSPSHQDPQAASCLQYIHDSKILTIFANKTIKLGHILGLGFKLIFAEPLPNFLLKLNFPSGYSLNGFHGTRTMTNAKNLIVLLAERAAKGIMSHVKSAVRVVELEILSCGFTLSQKSPQSVQITKSDRRFPHVTGYALDRRRPFR